MTWGQHLVTTNQRIALCAICDSVFQNLSLTQNTKNQFPSSVNFCVIPWPTTREIFALFASSW
jgi:hypothetical protein